MPPEQTTSGLRVLILGLYRDKGYIGITEKKMETTIVYWGYVCSGAGSRVQGLRVWAAGLWISGVGV